MPYVHQKTWVQLAPKIRNLSLWESPYGMGAARKRALSTSGPVTVLPLQPSVPPLPQPAPGSIQTPQQLAWALAEQSQRVLTQPNPSQPANWLSAQYSQYVPRTSVFGTTEQPANWLAAMASQGAQIPMATTAPLVRVGMGQAPFPATPCYDVTGDVIDCGGSSAGLTIVNPLPGQDTYTGYSLPASSSPSPSPSTTNSLAAWFQANQSMVLLGGAALFGLALISGIGRR